MEIMRNELYNKLLERNKKESQYFDGIIKDYRELLIRLKDSNSKVELLERENNVLKRITGDPVSMNELQSKIQSLEKELSDSLKENKINSNKLVDIISDNLKMKDTNDSLTKQLSTRTARLIELEQIVKEQDEQLIKLREDTVFLKSENTKLEKQNISLNEHLNAKTMENNKLITEILNIKNEYINKLNECNELMETARKKRDVE
jgi:chromosome segregation ATPase